MSTEIKNITQKFWGWKVAAHLFLVAAGAGAYVIGFVFSLIEPFLSFQGLPSQLLIAAKVGIITAIPLIILGAIFLFANLGTKANSVRAFNRPFSSWLSRGSYIALLFILFDLILIGTWVSTPSKSLPGFNLVISIVCLVLALALLVYSGMLLKVLKPFAIWNSSLLPPLFAISGIATGAMFVLLILAIYGFSSLINMIQPFIITIYYLILFLILQIVILISYMRRATINASCRSPLLKMFKGQTALVFWLGVVIPGLFLPLIIGLYLVLVPIESSILLYVLTIILTIFGITGSYILRYSVLSKSTAREINICGQMVELPETAFIPASRQVKYN